MTKVYQPRVNAHKRFREDLPALTDPDVFAAMHNIEEEDIFIGIALLAAIDQSVSM